MKQETYEKLDTLLTEIGIILHSLQVTISRISDVVKEEVDELQPVKELETYED